MAIIGQTALGYVSIQPSFGEFVDTEGSSEIAAYILMEVRFNQPGSVKAQFVKFQVSPKVLRVYSISNYEDHALPFTTDIIRDDC